MPKNPGIRFIVPTDDYSGKYFYNRAEAEKYASDNSLELFEEALSDRDWKIICAGGYLE